MKKNIYSRTLSVVVAVIAMAVLLDSCKKDSEVETPQPTLTSFSPEKGTVGTSVTIVGENFGSTSAEKEITFNGTPAVISSSTSTQITAAVPQGASSGKIKFRNKSSEKFATSAADFVVLVPPTITSFNPVSGIIGTTVTITGTNFSIVASENVVKFNNNRTAEVISATATQIVTKVPMDAVGGKIQVTVQNMSALSSNDFDVIQPPTLTSFSPAAGPVGTAVTITGTNFSSVGAENTVTIDGKTAEITSNTTTQLIVTVPAGATSGKVIVTVRGLAVISTSDFGVYNPPVITSFTPESGPVAIEVTINGNNFGTTSGSNTVKFNGIPADITSFSATQLKVNVPTNAISGKITVTNTSTSLTGTSAADFIFLPTPTVQSVSPAIAAAPAIVIITGTNFSTVASENEVTIGGKSASITSFTQTQLIVTVPSDAALGNTSIVVKSKGVSATSSPAFTVAATPMISSFSPSSGLPPSSTGFEGTTVIISGSNFNPSATNSMVVFNDTKTATVTAATTTQLTVIVPSGATTGKVKLTSYGVTVESASDFTVNPTNAWTPLAALGIPVSNFIVRMTASSFTIGTKVYVFGGNDGNTAQKDLWEYDTQTNTWRSRAALPGSARDNAAAFAIGGKGYVCAGVAAGIRLRDLWEYNPSNDSWVQKADLPTQARSAPFGFSIGSKGYVGGGLVQTAPLFVASKELWEYDPTQGAQGTWTQKADLPIERYYAYSFVVGSKGYVGGGRASGSGTTRAVHAYDPLNDKWDPVSQPPTNVYTDEGAFGFTIGLKGFLVSDTNFYSYNPDTNSWTQKANVPTGLSYGIGTSINHVGYMGTGREGFVSQKFFKYTPD
jgi:hypothetical protein